jgi:hypothetical protein
LEGTKITDLAPLAKIRPLKELDLFAARMRADLSPAERPADRER